MAITDVDTAGGLPLAHNWGAVVLRGVAGIAFGLMTLFVPGISLAALVLLFGAYALVDGVLSLVSAMRRRGTARWGGLVLQGLCGIAAGVITFVWPRITAFALLYLVAAWAIVTGVFQIAVAIRLRRSIRGEWLLILSGLAAVALGVLLALFPGPGKIALVLWIGAYALVTGVLLVALGLRLRGWDRSHFEPAPASA